MTALVHPSAGQPNADFAFKKALIGEYGELMDGAALRRLLHMGSERTFRRAALAGHLPVSVFQLAGRKGWFARTRDVAAWLASLGSAPERPGIGGDADRQTGCARTAKGADAAPGAVDVASRPSDAV